MKNDVYVFLEILKIALLLGFLPVFLTGIAIVTAYKALQGDFYEETYATASKDKNKLLSALPRVWGACRRYMLAMPVRFMQAVSAQISKAKPFLKRRSKESML